ncbi:MAG: hypothetical protein JW776_16385 [Candidatus Lokiarchaeota archaeon]|nr:hypothetical protein [Candidatus Lokiarchaeota archaeon]
MYDFREFERELLNRWMQQFKSGEGIGDFSWKKNGSTSLYGTTDMLISKFIVGHLNLTEIEKDEWAGIINSFQDPITGWYKKTYTMHYKEHTSAYAVAGLHLINRSPKYAFSWKNKIIQSEKARKGWISGDWRLIWTFIWPGSHVISGIPAMLAMTKQAEDEFFNWYFNWLDKQADPHSGFYLRGIPHRLGLIRNPTMRELGGVFHMLYIYEWFNRKWPHAEKIVDQCIRLQHENGLWHKDVTYCIDLDGLYSMIRSSRNANWYRKEEVIQSVCRYLETASYIFNNEEFFFKEYSNSHILTGALAAIAECQKWFPELVKTTKLWTQSLDYACYI